MAAPVDESAEEDDADLEDMVEPTPGVLRNWDMQAGPSEASEVKAQEKGGSDADRRNAEEEATATLKAEEEEVAVKKKIEKKVAAKKRQPQPMGLCDEEGNGGQIAAARAVNDLAAAARQTASRQGWLVKQGQKRKSWKKRWFMLSQHQLVYYNKQPKGKANSEPLGVLNLSSHSTIEARDPSLFSFVIGSADRELVVKAGARGVEGSGVH